MENGGHEMFLKANDYETELSAIELEQQLNPDETLQKQKKEVQKRKLEFDT